MQNKLREKFLSAGVEMIDPGTVYFREDTIIGKGVEIEPFVVFGKDVVIEDNVTIKAFTHIENSVIRSGSSVGPFARLRGGADVGPNVQIGDFVEVKNSRIENGAKVNHLAYIGDAEIGEDTNIGAGVITCNYDGFKKSKTVVGKKSFIGSNSALVAPVEIKDGVIVGAGSVVTKNVEENSIVLSRADQKEIPSGAIKYRAKKQSKK